MRRLCSWLMLHTHTLVHENSTEPLEDDRILTSALRGDVVLIK